MAFNLEEVDVDGAIRDGAEEVSGDTRLSFLKKGAENRSERRRGSQRPRPRCRNGGEHGPPGVVRQG
jgi:hypothetical protein